MHYVVLIQPATMQRQSPVDVLCIARSVGQVDLNELNDVNEVGREACCFATNLQKVTPPPQPFGTALM